MNDKRVEAAAAWKPIETAPRDVVILVYCPDDSWMGTALKVEDFSSKGYALFSEELNIIPGYDLITHWQPLPAPPSDATEGER